jgi:hypothetical protein
VLPIHKKIGDTYEFGYSLRFSQNVVRENGFVDEILRAYDRASYGMAKKINTDMITNFSANALAPALTGDSTPTLADGAWNESDNISGDIIQMQENMDQDDWDYELSDLFVAKSEYYSAKQYYRKASPSLKWDPTDVEGANLTNVKSNITAGSILGMDMTAKPVTTYKNTNPKFSSDPKHSLVMVNKYESEKYPYPIVIDIFCEMGIAVKSKHAMSWNTGF